MMRMGLLTTSLLILGSYTTATGQMFTIGGQAVQVPAATSGSFVRVVVGKNPDQTPATVSVLGNSLTADQFVFEKNGAQVQVSGSNLGLLLQAGSQRVLQITNASFTFQFSRDGILTETLVSAADPPHG